MEFLYSTKAKWIGTRYHISHDKVSQYQVYINFNGVKGVSNSLRKMTSFHTIVI